ncbi:hypothetical protein EPO15_10795 [bacterium]|nr:MAG: hypothetical protein EPO15_10795 [bacterium]
MTGPLLAFLLASSASAGQLGGFEKALVQPAQAAPAKSSSKGKTVSFGSGELAGSDCEPFLLCALLQIAAATYEPTAAYAAARPLHMPILPLLRLDGVYQLIPKDIDALSGRVELGRGSFGAAYERILFREKEPRDRMWGWRGEALWRMAVGEGARLDAAIGYMGFQREGSHNGASTGLSFGWYPSRAVGYEVDARWGSIGDGTATDLRGRLYLGPRSWGGLALRPGYRGIRTGDATLHGPELTVSYSW